MHIHGMTTYVCMPSRIFCHIHYKNSDLRRHFFICGYGIFPSLSSSMSYPWNMSAYHLCISLSFSFIYTLWRHFFVLFSFVSTLYHVLSPSVSTLDLILSPPVSMLDLVFSWFDLISNIFPTPRTWNNYCGMHVV